VAEVTIKIEDRTDGKVKVTCSPNFETMMMMAQSGAADLTAAHGYAFACLNKIQEISKQTGPMKILLPKNGK
jgi:hypothetical protein